ncbi:uncharacterized protein LOC134216382 [Armigeres subalbatus]|uniref:uncharacterized protein LOC134216382 n=1 Tax=Armigeres subalbatus TaxID=124917 RepID=UPI002ECFE015
MKVILILTAIVGLASTQREDSLNVVDVMSLLPTAYRDLQTFVISAVADAKHNSSDAIYDFHREVYLAKDTFLRSAVNMEVNTLYQLNNQPLQVDAGCLTLLRGSADLNLQVSGVGFTNCIVEVDSRLNEEIQQVYDQLQVNESSYVQFSLYDAFVGRNIFQNPQDITDQLYLKLAQLQQTPTELVAQLNSLVSDFRLRLDVARSTYRQCLTVNNQVLQTANDLILIQLQQICRGSLVSTPTLTTPALTTTQVPQDSPAGPPTVQVDEFNSI